MTILLKLLITLIPYWPVKRFLLCKIYGYTIHKSSHIGLSFIYPISMNLAEGARIGSLTICKGIEYLSMENNSSIGRLNWITGFPKVSESLHFADFADRNPCLILRSHSAITNRHLLDCTDSIEIGEFTTIAGFASQMLTHSINLQLSRQECSPIKIGKYCFIGTNSVILPGSCIADYVVVAASALVPCSIEESYVLYGGVPARKIKSIDPNANYFNRNNGYVI